MFLSVIIPAFNEEKRVKNTLLEVNEYLSNQRYDSEIIVVNDGSKDKTAEIVRGLGIKNLQTINNTANQGKGHAVRQGLLKAVGKYRLFMDADSSTSIKEVAGFLANLNTYDIVIGSRSIKGSKIINPQPLHRRILGRFYSYLFLWIVKLKDIQDTQCGFKIFRSNALEDILPKCSINGWSFDVEILILAQKLKYKVKESPVTWSNQPETKVQIKGMVKSIIDLVKIKWNLVTGRYSI